MYEELVDSIADHNPDLLSFYYQLQKQMIMMVALTCRMSVIMEDDFSIFREWKTLHG